MSISIEVKKLFPDAKVPEKAHDRDAGWDCFAYRYAKGGRATRKGVNFFPGEIVEAHLGIAVNVPKGFYLQVVPKSGLARKSGITIINSPGTIDSGYQGEIIALLFKLSRNAPDEMKIGDKVCQLILREEIQCSFETVEEFSETTKRGTGGFGSSGR